MSPLSLQVLGRVILGYRAYVLKDGRGKWISSLVSLARDPSLVGHPIHDREVLDSRGTHTDVGRPGRRNDLFRTLHGS